MGIFDDPRGWAARTLAEWLGAAGAFMPNLLWALLLLLGGWLGARLIRLLIVRFGRGLDALLATIQRQLGGRPTRSKWSIAAVIGAISYWLVIGLALIAASEVLGLYGLAEWLRELLGYLPTLLISAMILFIGYLISDGLRELISSIAVADGMRHGRLLGQLTSVLVSAFALLLALDHLGLNVGLLEKIMLLAVGALFGGMAIAFGIGAGDSVRNIIAAHYLRRVYQPGQYVQVEGEGRMVTGEILEMTEVGVLLETDQGPQFIPARAFMEGRPVILEEEVEEGDPVSLSIAAGEEGEGHG